LAELVAEQITVRFGGIQALNEVDVVVRPGTVHGLIGPNGAGKTTLFNVITGLQPPTRGRVRFDGADITRSSPHVRARRGMARTFQRLELFDTLTARENVQMAAETQRRRLPAGTTPTATTERLLAEVGLLDIADEPTDSLPTGLARLVELARAMATTPSVLLLDEPSAGLNHEETTALGKILVTLASDGMAVLLVEHDMSLVMSICDAVTVLHYGEIITSGDPASVQADPAVQAAYLGTEDVQPQPTHDRAAAGLRRAAPAVDDAVAVNGCRARRGEHRGGPGGPTHAGAGRRERRLRTHRGRPRCVSALRRRFLPRPPRSQRGG
jgi:branched-chain amino acid transport system ATP-binding protein